MAQNALTADYEALQGAAARRGLSLESCAAPVSPATAAQLVADFEVKLPPDALRYLALSNGLRIEGYDGDEVLFGGQFRAPSLRELVREYRRVWETPDDAVAVLDCVFPIFISEYGEFLGFGVTGRDSRLYEISLSNPQPVLAFSSLAKTLRVFAAYFEEANFPIDLTTAQRVHERLDPAAARIYWS